MSDGGSGEPPPAPLRWQLLQMADGDAVRYAQLMQTPKSVLDDYIEMQNLAAEYGPRRTVG